jgi:HK97 family phage major capsid protein
MPELIDLQAQRRNAIELARGISKKAEQEKREMTAEEQTNYRKYFDEAQSLKVKIDHEIEQRELDRELARLDAARTRPPGDGATNAEPIDRTEYRNLVVRDLYHNQRNERGLLKRHGLGDRDRKKLADIEDRAAVAYLAWAKGLALGERELTQGERRALNEYRDLMMGSEPAGGWTVPPEQFQATLIRKIDDRVYIRRMATKVVVTKAQDLGVPTLEDNPADADWTSELATGNDDTAMDFGERAFASHPLAKLIKVSKKCERSDLCEGQDHHAAAG